MNKALNLILLSIILIGSSCISFREIGKINMISNRNIERSLEYKLLTTYSGGSLHELKKSKAPNIQEAVDQTVKKIPGGEFLMNVKVYLVNDKYFAVEGDVWGLNNDIKDVAFRGFKVGDKVTWKKFGKFLQGKINALKDDKTCLVEDDKTKKIAELTYDQLTKVQ